jgi:hypothetical protein
MEFIVVFFILGDCLASEFYVPTFWNTLSIPYTPSMQMELRQCSETSAHKIQTPRNHPKERIQNSEQGGSLKSLKLIVKYYARNTKDFHLH